MHPHSARSGLPASRSPFLLRPATWLGLLLALGVPAVCGAAGGSALYAACAPCHGEQGQGDARNGVPNIAGLDAAYIERQLGGFGHGWRGAGGRDPKVVAMRSAVRSLATTDDRHAVAVHVAGLPAKAVTTLPSTLANADRKAGRNYFNGICSACHGGSAQGNATLGAPRLAGADPAYLLRQLQDFRSGARGSAADDRQGGQMRRVALRVPDEATLQGIVAFLAGGGP
jgi:cytochrome c553